MEKKKIFTKDVWDDVKLKKGLSEKQMQETFEKGFKEFSLCPICKQEKENISNFFKGSPYPICKDCLDKDPTLYNRGTKYLESLKKNNK